LKILLDTCTFLWILTADPQLSGHARKLFVNPVNEVWLSSVSSREISLKYALGRLPLPESPDRWIPSQRELHGIESLPLEEEATYYLTKLPDYHRDPFDRMLVCQAIGHGLTILTPDPLVTNYPARTTW
jgi:PIN domain nuclease of toxin-antitoxin system